MPEFALEGRMDIGSLIQTHLTPSRSVGPPDPDAPENTWLRGVAVPERAYVPASVPVREAPALTPAVPLPDWPREQEAVQEPQSPMDAIVQLAGSGAEMLMLSDGLCSFGNELFTLTEDERWAVVEIVLDAHDRMLRDRAAELRHRHMHKIKGPRPQMQESRYTGEALVPALHSAQGAADQQTEEVQGLREVNASPAVPVLGLQSLEEGIELAASNT